MITGLTAAPLSMHMHGISQQASNLGIQWHVIAMYGPGFFTGKLIDRFGAMRVAAAGLVISAGSVFAGLGGTEIVHYWLSLILLGIGWNFGFIGVMILGAFSSGVLLNLYGWNAVLWGSLVPLALALLVMIPGRRALTGSY